MYFRCTFIFTEEKFKDTIPSNIFLRASNKETAILGSKDLWNKKLSEAGISKALYHQEVIEVSEEEVAEYTAAKVNGARSGRLIN